jgi:hypothetical protein
MTPYKAVAMGIMLVVPLWAGFAAGQTKQSCDQMKAGARQQVEGKVARVDQTQGVVAVTEKDGTTHEFKASKETLQDLKVGDNIEARLRELPKC